GDAMTFASSPVPLRRIYFLEDSPAGELDVSRVEGAVLLKELIGSKFLLDSEDPQELKAAFDAAIELAQSGICYRLSMPRDLSRLHECAIQISEHAGGRFHREVTRVELDAQVPWVASQRLASSEIGGEAAVLNLADGNFYGLNDLASQVWRWLQEPRTVDQ